MIAVLVILQDRCHRFDLVTAVGFLDDLMQIEILDREVVVAVAVRSADRSIIGFLHRRAQTVLIGQIAFDGDDGAVDEIRRIVGLRGIEGWIALIGGAEAGDELFIRRIGQIDRPVSRSRNPERKFAGPIQ